MIVVEKNRAVSAKEVAPQMIKAVSSGLAERILEVLSRESCYPKEISKKLGVHEQKVYYHIRKLEKSGIVRVEKIVENQGVLTKYFALTKPAFVVRFGEFEDAHVQEKEESKFLEPFITNGKMNAKIIIGSHYAHGPEKARSNDGYYGIDLALFLGRFLQFSPGPTVKLDTEVTKEDLKENLILFGGPVVNQIVEKINAKMPIRFEKKGVWKIYSELSKKRYTADECGVIVKMQSPFDKNRFVLVIAGKRYSGTKAATLSFLQKFDEISKQNKYNKKFFAKVVEGFDMDGDGMIDKVEVRE